jgi:hypothetical protein
MQFIFSDSDRLKVHQIQQLLEGQGIECFLKNEFAIGAMGETAPLDSLPEVWLLDAGNASKAKHIIEQFESPPQRSSTWVCKNCQETNEPTFEICWQCGASAPTI